jgi:dihydroorotase
LWPKPESGGLPVRADSIFNQVVETLKPGDILAHPFSRHPGGFVEENGQLHPLVHEAVARGLKIDVGHGSHFSFAMARKVLAAGIKPHTLGADMHGYNVRVGKSDDPEVAANPFAGVAPFSLTHAMSELLALGLSLSEVVATVTCNPARMLGLGDALGMLAVGRAAEITVLDLLQGRFALSDNSGETVTASQLLRPVFAFKDGERFAADSPLVPPAISVAA